MERCLWTGMGISEPDAGDRLRREISCDTFSTSRDRYDTSACFEKRQLKQQVLATNNMLESK
jgi:hypothetical protein